MSIWLCTLESLLTDWAQGTQHPDPTGISFCKAKLETAKPPYIVPSSENHFLGKDKQVLSGTCYVDEFSY